MSGQAAEPGPGDRQHSDMASAPRQPRLVALYVILVLLLLISGLLVIGGQPLYGLLVLGIATLLNVRMLMLRNRLHGKPEK